MASDRCPTEVEESHRGWGACQRLGEGGGGRELEVSWGGAEVAAEQEPGRHAVPSEDGGAGARGWGSASLQETAPVQIPARAEP